MLNKDNRSDAFLDSFAQQLAQALSSVEAGDVRVRWKRGEPGGLAEDFEWWASTRAGESERFFYVGGTAETWLELGAGIDTRESRSNLYSALSLGLGQALNEPGAAAVGGAECSPGDVPTEGGVRFTLEVERTSKSYSLQGIVFPASLSTKNTGTASAAVNSMEMLMHVEVPVSVSFGSTRIRMRELLSLNSGSVVELDQALGDHVEVRVNSSVIARGEVVAVDGNYGVRILELVSGPGALNGSTK